MSDLLHAAEHAAVAFFRDVRVKEIQAKCDSTDSWFFKDSRLKQTFTIFWSRAVISKIWPATDNVLPKISYS